MFQKFAAAAGILLALFLALSILGSRSILFSQDGQAADDRALAMAQGAANLDMGQTLDKEGTWDGPVLYHYPPDSPIHLILVEKALQRLRLVRYENGYQEVKSYFCATGEKQGKKREESDEKTPEGIYFNDRTFRDNRITVFGDRAFGLNYPDIFDNINGNRGSGIFMHGSNRSVTSYSTNGCLTMSNTDIADLDQRVPINRTPFIIGERLPYRFGPSKRDLSELIPFLKQALLPEPYAGKPAEFDTLTVLAFEDRVVAVSRLRINTDVKVQGVSRLYFAGPGSTLLVLLKREWEEEKRETILAQKPKPEPTPVPRQPAARPAGEDAVLVSLVDAWRSAWEDKRLDAYISHYHPAFSSKGNNLSQWKAYKAGLNQRYRRISVQVVDLRVKVQGNTAHAYFRQQYRSDGFRANSYKILEFRKNGGNWKIYREDSYPEKQSGWPA